MSVLASPPAFAWPADVLDYARRHGLEPYLEPLREAIVRLFPSLAALSVVVEYDGELAGVAWVAFDISVPAADVPDSLAASRLLFEAKRRVVPGDKALAFCLTLVRLPG